MTTSSGQTRQRGSSIKRVELANGQVRWRFRVDLEPERDDTGKVVRRRQQTITCRTEREAIEAQSKARVDVAAGVHVEPTKLTVRGICDAWRTARALSWKPSTRATNEIALESLLEHIGSIPVQRLRAEDVDRAIGLAFSTGGRSGVGRSAYTVRTSFVCLKAALDLARRRGYVARNVAEDVDAPRTEDRERQVWSLEELNTFLRAVEDDQHVAGWYLAAHGLRRGEICAAKFSDVDWKRGVLRVRRNAVLVGNEVVNGTPKTERSKRDVPLSPEAMTVLRAARDAGNVVSIRGRDDRFVVTDDGGQQIRPDAFARRFQMLAAEAGLPRLRFHDVRHSVATHMMRTNGRADVIARVLGHDVAVLLKIYSHPSEDDARGLIDGFMTAVVGG